MPHDDFEIRKSVKRQPSGVKRRNPAKNSAHDGNFVYLAEAFGEDLVKVGKTRNLQSRSRTLNNASAFRVRFIGYIRVPDGDEHRVEALCLSRLGAVAKRMNGEWFASSPEAAAAEVLAVAGLINISKSDVFGLVECLSEKISAPAFRRPNRKGGVLGDLWG